MEFNTNYNNLNRQAYVGPIQTTNTTVSNPNTEYQTIITKHSVTYVTKTPDVTVVTNINRVSGEIETNTYVTGTEIIPDDFDVNEPESFLEELLYQEHLILLLQNMVIYNTHQLELSLIHLLFQVLIKTLR